MKPAPLIARTLLIGALAIALAACIPTAEKPDDHAALPEIRRRADDLPPPVDRKKSERVVIELTTKEVTASLAPGVTYEYWTYNGTVPGPFLRVREGDTVEIRLTHSAEEHGHAAADAQPLLALDFMPTAWADAMDDGHADAEPNDDDEEGGEDPHSGTASDDHAAAGHAEHSIDLHAVIGPGGGAALTQVKDGETKVFQFVALRPGLYVYHCASAHIPTHVANGMYGMILVEPAEGLPPIDREFYVMQGEFYTAGPLGQKGRQEFSKQKLLAEKPEYVVFNGRTGALRKESALRAKAGEKIRLFFGVGSHLASNFHVIGGVLDRLYPEGAIASAPLQNIQTTVVPPGGAMVTEFTIDVPGTYLLVDHSLTRAIDRGAVAELVIEGKPRPDLFSAVNPDPSHAHADFAVYIRGEKLDFSRAEYMEEEGSHREHEEHGHSHTIMHMHGGEGDVIHRHKPGQSFGAFFVSLGFELTADCLALDDGRNVCNEGADRWRMFVNGQERPIDPDYVFEDSDRILLTFAPTPTQLTTELDALSDEACLYSRTCPERGAAPPENCVADPKVPCTAPLD